MADASRRFVIKFVGDVKSAISEIGKLDDKFASLGGRQKAVVGAAAAGGAALGGIATAGFSSAIKKAASYEQQISAVGAVAQASKEEIKQLNDTGLRIGSETAFSATEAAQAMEVLAASGISVNDIVGGAADATVALAAAGGTDLVTAANLAGSAMGVWGVEAKDLTDVVNRFAGSANVSKFGVEDMALAVGQGAGVAAAAGVSYQDFATAIAAIAPAFTSGSDAGTGMKTFIQRLVPQSKEATNAMRDLGLIGEDGLNKFFDQEGNFAGMTNAAGLLDEALSGLSDEAATDALTTIFGSDASRAAAMLAETGAEKFTAMSDAMKNTDAATMAAQRMDNLAGALEQLNGAIESLQISVGTEFLPVLTKGVRFLAEWLPKIPGEVYLLVGAFMLLAGAAAFIGFALLPFITMGSMLGLSTLPMLTGAFATLAGAAGIGLVIAALAALWIQWDKTYQRGLEANAQLRGMIQANPDSPQAQQAFKELSGTHAVESPWRTIFGNAPTSNKTTIKPPAGGWTGGLDGEFATGGVVPGPVGAPFRALVHGGETIIPPGKGMGGVVINVHGSVIGTMAELERMVVAALNDAKQRGGLGFA